MLSGHWHDVLMDLDSGQMLPNPYCVYPGVLEEAEFYNIALLVRLVKERIRDLENRTSQVSWTWLFALLETT